MALTQIIRLLLVTYNKAINCQSKLLMQTNINKIVKVNYKMKKFLTFFNITIVILKNVLLTLYKKK